LIVESPFVKFLIVITWMDVVSGDGNIIVSLECIIPRWYRDNIRHPNVLTGSGQDNLYLVDIM